MNKMICFLTSDIVIPGTDKLNNDNHFLDLLRIYYPHNSRGLFICSSPSDYEKTDFYGYLAKHSFEREGFKFSEYNILDNRTQNDATYLIENSNFIILAGGHVPTQNEFFERIHLRELLKKYDGIIVSISAGTMNASDEVYAQPECDGEAIDPNYKKFYQGLDLTKHIILPHYQVAKDVILDGLRMYEDITFNDSYGKEFFAFVDGTFMLIINGNEEIHGEAYLVKDATIKKISNNGDILK